MQGKDQGEAKENANKQSLEHLYQQGGQKGGYTILDQEKKNGKVIANKANKGNGAKRILASKEIISTMKITKKVWCLYGSEMSEGL
jgi:hypothetical protein